MDKGWLSPKEAGDRVGRTSATIIRWCKEGIIPSRTVPGAKPSYLIDSDFVGSLPGHAVSKPNKSTLNLDALRKQHGKKKNS